MACAMNDLHWKEPGLQYFAIRQGQPEGVPITLLHIGAEQTLIVSGKDSEPESIVTLAIGAQKTAAEHFRHSPPTPGEMENAIMRVEDEVARARGEIAENSALFTNDPAIREIARLAGLTERPVMRFALEQVEMTFERLMGLSYGRPASGEGLPTDAAFAATLLIMREFMHHLKFSSIDVLSPPAT